MEYRTLEQKFLADYAAMERENERLEKQVEALECRLANSIKTASERGERVIALEKRLQEQVIEIHTLRRRLNQAGAQ